MYFIKLPEHIPMKYALTFVGLLFAAQLVEGTTLILGLESAAFILLSVAAFNVAGGAVYASGAFVMSAALLTAIIGITAKAALGEPLQSTLREPQTTMLVYVLGMTAMLAACYCSRMFRPARAMLDGFQVRGNTNGVAIGCIALGILLPFVLPDQLRQTFQQGNNFLNLALLLTVSDRVRSTNGRKSFSPVALFAWAWLTFFGILGFSKQAMFTPTAVWMIAAVAGGVWISARKAVILGVCAVLGAGILTPYSQIGKTVGTNLPLGVSITIAYNLLSNPIYLREQYAEGEKYLEGAEEGITLFKKPEGLFDRLNMLAMDDALVAATDRGDKAPASNLWTYVTNLVPRFLDPNKKNYAWGNMYGHTVGVLADDDDGTGISFSPFADGYHCALWTGVTIYSFGLYLFGFFIADSVGGNANRSIWALLYVMYSLHAAPEFLLDGPVYMGGTFTVFLIGIAFTCARLIPAVTNALSKRPEQANSFATSGRVS